MAQNLWGEIVAETKLKLPVTILNEQATILGEVTNRILEAVVESTVPSKKGLLSYGLFIVAPALNNYKYNVLDIEHDIVFAYPVSVYDVVGPSDVLDIDESDAEKVVCNSEEEFLQKLGQLLSSEQVHKIIESLIAQSKASTAMNSRSE